jgi:hypothetical protein
VPAAAPAAVPVAVADEVAASDSAVSLPPVVDELADELVDGSVCVAVVPVVEPWSPVVWGCATIGVAVSSAVTAAIGTYRMVMMQLSVSRWLQRPCLRAVVRHAVPPTPSSEVRHGPLPRRRYCKRRRDLQAAH